MVVRWSGSNWCPAVVCVLVAGELGWWLLVVVFVVVWVLCEVALVVGECVWVVELV